MSTTGAVVLIVIVVLVIVAIAVLASSRAKKRRTETLQGRFGPEYDRSVDQHGDQKAAESHLSDVADRRDQLDIRELGDAERARYTDRWQQVQADFVDSPRAATRDADRLINEVMRERGYPVDDFDTRADMVAADHPEVVEHYRAAHNGADGDPTTEEQRRSFVHFRALFVELVGVNGEQNGGHEAGSDTADDPARDDRTADDRTADRTAGDTARGAGDTGDQRSIDLTEGERAHSSTTTNRGTTERDDAPPTR
jgi:hypothetical protein